jgi:5-methyltetrahydrofolate--homocysteine methyltransferase
MNPKLEPVYKAILSGAREEAVAAAETAVDQGVDVSVILNEGLIAAMREVGRLFENNQYFVPEMLISARAMQSALAVLRPYLVDADVQPVGKLVVGTVQGDLHDIGKNLVAMMVEGAGFEIIDLGTDVEPEEFVKAVRDHQADLVGLSALLTTTLPMMEKTIQALEEAGLRERVKVMIGGAPATPDLAEKIGADAYAPDASQAAAMAQQLLGI